MDQVISPNWPLWEIAKTALALLGLGGLTIAGAVTVAFAFFKWFGASWIENKFKIELELYKSEQSRELARLNHKINGLSDRAVRLHTKEFELLPDVYGKLVDAFASAENFLSPIQLHADVEKMNDAELDEYLNDTQFSNYEKHEIKVSDRENRQRIFVTSMVIHRYQVAHEKIVEFSTAYRKSNIFFRSETQRDMEDMIELIRRAMLEKQYNASFDFHPKFTAAYKKFDAEAKPLLEKIKQSVSERLWDATSTEV